MTLSLYDVIIPAYQQTLGSMAVLLDKGEAFCNEHGIEEKELTGARLAEDMLHFTYQVKAVTENSLGAIEGIRLGNFTPTMPSKPEDFSSLKARIATALAGIDALSSDEVNDFLGRDMKFTLGEKRIDFTAENFLLSFALPNFYFHAVTAYDLLRVRGVKLGKMVFLGEMRTKL